jgi:hypothetical protein
MLDRGKGVVAIPVDRGMELVVAEAAARAAAASEPKPAGK